MKKIAFVVAVISLMAIFLSGCDQTPPTIKHAEFPFHLKYEYQGKVYDIKDTVVCDFSGFDMSGEVVGKMRTWDEHLKSGRDRISILSDYNVASVLNPKRIDSRIEVYCNYGDGDYYMGDPNASSAIYAKPEIDYIEVYNESPKVEQHYGTKLTKEQLQKYFGIKIIEWTFSKPIKNTFRGN